MKLHKSLLFGAMLSTLLIYNACNDDNHHENTPDGHDTTVSTSIDTLAIFFINDQHGQLDNFAKIKHIVDAERAKNEHVLLVCAGDMFSGNPIVDQYEQKGFPMIDIMNETGFDIAVLGNHEFDYGPENLKDRMNQAAFQWICANVNMLESGVPQPEPFLTLNASGIDVTFLGLVETFGKPDDIIPSTHPWKVNQMKFQRHYDVLDEYQNLKEEEQSDVFIALTHLGGSKDITLANQLPKVDAIIGGHSHQFLDKEENGIPVLQTGSYLEWLGKLEIILDEDSIITMKSSFTNLDEYPSVDDALKTKIDAYNNAAQFEEVVGYTSTYLDRTEIGCFYTTALMEYLEVDCAFQNHGGIRSSLSAGDITALDIYNMDPFNNQSVIFTLTAKEIADFFEESRAGLHISGITLRETSSGLVVYNSKGQKYADDDLVLIGINDYIPAVYDQYFPLEKAEILEMTTAETIIAYLKTINNQVDAEGCNQYFEY